MLRLRQINTNLDSVGTLIREEHYKNAIEDSLSLLAEILIQVYKEIIVELTPKQKLTLINKEEEIENGKSIRKFNIGKLVVLFDLENLFKQYENFVSGEFCFFNKPMIMKLNEIRVKCTHHGYTPTKNEAEFVLTSLKNIFDELNIVVDQGLVGDEDSNMEISIVNKIEMNNLMRPDYDFFIGRKEYVERIKSLFGDERCYIVSIDGIGGVGKSSLTIEYARQAWSEKKYEAIVWVSAKVTRLKITGIEDIAPTLNNLDELLNVILSTFGFPELKKFSSENKLKEVRNMLGKVKTLLIIDNLETIEDEGIFKFILDVPKPTHVIATTRKKLVEGGRYIVLKEFSLSETREFLEKEAEIKGWKFTLDASQQEILQKVTGGIPLALKIVTSWINTGVPLEKATANLKESKPDILKFCFQESFDKFLSNDAKLIFSVFPILNDFATKEQIKIASGLSGDRLEEALFQLIQLSFVNIESRGQEDNKCVENYYSMLPLTLAFAYEKLMLNRGLEKDARKRLAEYYKLNMQQEDALKQYGLALEDLGGQTEKGRTSALLANLAFATYQRGNSKEAERLFKEAVEADPHLSYSIQLWATVERQKGNNARAEELFKRAAELNPNNSIIWSSWSTMKKEEGDLQKAEVLLEEGIRKQSKTDLYLLHQLIIIKSMLGKYSEAVRLAKEKLISDPKNNKERWNNTLFLLAITETLWRQAHALFEEGKHFEAEQLYQNALETINKWRKGVFQNEHRLVFQEKKIYRRLGLNMRRLKKPDEAENYLSKSLFAEILHPNDSRHNIIVEQDRIYNYLFVQKKSEAVAIAKAAYAKYKDPIFLPFLN